MKKLLPQANTLELVIKTFIYASNKPNCCAQDIADFCKFEPRQSNYYAGACMYLGILDEDFQVTELGKKILKEPGKVRLQIYELIMNDELMGKVCNKYLLYSRESALEYAVQMVYDLYPEYSEAVQERRATSIVRWCDDIVDYIKR